MAAGRGLGTAARTGDPTNAPHLETGLDRTAKS